MYYVTVITCFKIVLPTEFIQDERKGLRQTCGEKIFCTSSFLAQSERFAIKEIRNCRMRCDG